MDDYEFECSFKEGNFATKADALDPKFISICLISMQIGGKKNFWKKKLLVQIKRKFESLMYF